MKKNLAQQLEKVEALSTASKWKRLLKHPIKYVYAILLKNAWYPIFRKEHLVSCTLFTGQKVKVLLPASTDIYLTGGKSHHSEIRLARFLISNLKANHTFWDIGAHYGYFSLLSSRLVGAGGKVLAIEASPTTFNILKQNTLEVNNILVFQKAVSASREKISFYELPNLYSEYNTSDLKQFEKESWFAKITPQKVEVEATTLDDLMTLQNQFPDIIKIDVEGGEFAVIKGGIHMLKNQTKAPMIVMEYVEPKRSNRPHQQATATLQQLGFHSYLINNDGSLYPVNNIDQHLLDNHLESDNIVFKK